MKVASVYSIIADAANIRREQSPEPYTRDMFLEMYPKFSDVPDVMIDSWIAIALESLQYGRWKSYWKMGLGLFVAHHLTLITQGNMADSIEAGLMKGVATSKSVTDMSISYDFGSVANEFAGWGTYPQTVYGQQLVQFARLVSKGGMTIW